MSLPPPVPPAPLPRTRVRPGAAGIRTAGIRIAGHVPYAVCAALLLLLTGCGAGSPDAGRVAGLAGGPAGEAMGAPGPAALMPPRPPAPQRDIPALGPRTMDAIPAGSRQVFVVSGESADSNRSTAALWSRDNPTIGWHPVTEPWSARNALNGWTEEHWVGDLRSPVGVYTLTAAGGRLAPPATRLPYERNDAFTVSGEGFEGEPLDGSFDYVIAIDYNRTAGASPLDQERPLGEERGGGIWIHVDHGGPTQGCVSLPEGQVKELMSLLDPAQQPVIVMGDAASLAR